MAYVTALFEPRRWYELVPDEDHALVTQGWGKFGDFNYASAAPDAGREAGHRLCSRQADDHGGYEQAGRPGDGLGGTTGKREVPGDRRLAVPERRGACVRDDGETISDGAENEDWVLVLETEPPAGQP